MHLINKLAEMICEFNFFSFNFVITDYMLALFICPSLFMAVFFSLNHFVQGKKLLIIVYDIFFKHFSNKFGDQMIPYMPFLFSLFCFVYCFNFCALFPLLYTVTSRFKFTFSISIIIFTIIARILFKTHSFKIWKAFVPKGLPIFMMPIMFIIEFGLFLIKPLVLAFRLSLNIAIGHIILDTFSNFANGGVSNIITLLVLVMMVIFEIIVGLLQTYILVLLSATYMKEMLPNN